MKRVVTIDHKIGDKKVHIVGIVHLGTNSSDNPDEVTSIASDCERDIVSAIAQMRERESHFDAGTLDAIERDVMREIEERLVDSARTSWCEQHGVVDIDDIRDVNGVRGMFDLGDA